MKIIATDGWAWALMTFAIIGFATFLNSIFHIADIVKGWIK